jgi:hypothetical protein
LRWVLASCTPGDASKIGFLDISGIKWSIQSADAIEVVGLMASVGIESFMSMDWIKGKSTGNHGFSY